MKARLKLFVSIIIFGFTFINATKNDSEEFPEKKYNFAKNPISENGILLGKKLFYDPILSRDGSISCAECHNQPFAFTHHEHAISHGVDDKIGIRNAPTLVNLAYQPYFFWDGGVFDLDLVHVVPISNPVEMDQDLNMVLEKLKADKNYKTLFKNAFGTEEITSERFLKAISQFLLQLESKNSRYDQFIAGKIELSNDEKEGLQLFKSKGCVSCHKTPLFTDFSFKSNGLDTTYFRKFVDYGRYKITENESDKNKFKVPTLRNIANTKPYMHDGRFETLQQVLQFYASGMTHTQNLDPIFIKQNKIGLELSTEEQNKIIAFLNTLTDDEFLKNSKFIAE